MFLRITRKHLRLVFVCIFLMTLISVLLWGNSSNANKNVGYITSPALAPILSATKTGVLLTDTGGPNGVINPGDSIRYTVTINNTGPDPATNVVINDTIDANTTLIGGSVVASPIAVNDAYSSIGNVGITVPDGASDLLGNDFDANNPGSPALVFTLINATPFMSGTPVATTNGTVTVNSNGSFSYMPNPGFEGMDTFTYTLANGTGFTDSSTVTITVSGMIWFVDNSAGINGNGRLGSPFNSLANFNAGAADDPGDNIFLYRQTATDYTGGITLLANQKLIGQGATATLASITGITVPTFSNPLPATGGTRPTLTHSANNVTLGTGNTLRGLNIQSTGGSALFGTSFNNLNASENTASATGGTAAVNLDQASGTASINVTFISISANGSSSGIILADTTGSFTITGDAGSTNNSSGGTIQNITNHGISLSNVQNISFDQLNIQTTGGSGINGVSTTNFSFTNGTVNNSGNAVGESNIAFNGNGTLMGNNLNGTLTVTGSTLTSAFNHGIHVENDAGTISNAVIQNNTITSTTSTATSTGTGIQLIGTGNASTASVLTRATISNNTIRNFPSAAGIQVIYGNSNASGPAGISGTPGSATDIISITNNVVRGFSAANRLGTHAIAISTNGGNSSQRSQGNFNVSNNGTVGNPIGDSLGTVILIGNNGFATMTATVDNNVIVANNTVASQGIGGGNGVLIGCPARCENPDLTLTVTNNNISQVDGNGILLVGRGTTGIAKFGVRNNTVAAPLTGVRPGIRIDAGNNAVGSDDAVCLDLRGNTTGGSGGHEGIGLRKQGSVTTTHDFGIEGMAATSSPGIEQYVGNGAGLNPGSANGSFGTNGVLLISATSGFSNCSSAPLVDPVINVKEEKLALTERTDNSVIVTSETSQTPKETFSLTNSLASFGSAFINVIGSLSDVITPTANAQESKNVKRTVPESGENITKALGTLPPGENIRVQFDVTVDATIPANDFSVSNAAGITADGGINISSTTATNTVVQPPTIGKAFSPTSIIVNGTSTLTLTVTNPNPTQAFTQVAFTDAFPSGLVVASPLTTTNNCGGTLQDSGGGVLGAGDTGIRLVNGTRAANGSCTITVVVTSATEGTYSNTTGNVSSFEGLTGNTASANLNVVTAPSFTKNFGVATLPLTQSTSLTFSITNNSTVSSLTNVSFTDTLPAGLVVATPNGLMGSCSGGTITATAGSNSISLSGATLSTSTNCGFSVNVTATTTGMKNNSVDLSTTETGTGPTAMASVDVPSCTVNPVVTNIMDIGSGSLRQAVIDACDGSTITFDNAGVFANPQTITLTTGEIIIGKNLTINGTGANRLSVSGNNASRIFNISGGFTANISGLTITGGNAGVSAGGGIICSGNLNLSNSVVSGNTANSAGGGIIIQGGSTNITNSTISGNSATGGTFNGGGIQNNSSGTINITNSTISGNTATGQGGGFRNIAGTVTVTNSTITNNTAGNSAGGVSKSGGTLTVSNSIVAGNVNNTTIPDVVGTFVSSGFNLIGNVGSATGFTQPTDQTGTGAMPINPKLSSLVNNGGATLTHKLMKNSPALDKGNSFGSTTDQRGLPRPFDIPSIPNASGGDGSDIGAYESQNLPTDVVVDFDGDGKSDPAVIVIPMTYAENNSAEAEYEKQNILLGGDILARERQRIWSHAYEKLLNYRSGRGFVPLPKEVEDAQQRWKQNPLKNPFELNQPEAGLMWQIRQSSNGATLTYMLGTTTDVVVPSDYDGDGKWDAAVWTPSTGVFTVIFSSDLSTQTYTLGNMMSDPTVVGDYDGDGRADPAVYDASTGLWSYLGGANHTVLTQVTFGANGIPAPGDYDGDGKFDFGIQVPPVSDSSVAKFRIAYNDGTVQFPDLGIAYGLATYAIVPGDYDGDGKTDIAQANYFAAPNPNIVWRVLQSSTNYTVQVKTDFGLVSTDRTVQGDYDGDGKTDRAVFRSAAAPNDGVFIILQSSTSTTVTIDWGGQNDYPVAFYNNH